MSKKNVKARLSTRAMLAEKRTAVTTSMKLRNPRIMDRHKRDPFSIPKCRNSCVKITLKSVRTAKWSINSHARLILWIFANLRQSRPKCSYSSTNLSRTGLFPCPTTCHCQIQTTCQITKLIKNTPNLI